MSSLIETTDYDNFHPESYLAAYKWMENRREDETDLFQFFLDALHAIFSSGIIKGQRLLDIGTGPTIKTLVSSGMHVDEIYLSDINQENRTILTSWWMGDVCLDSEVVDYILKIENASYSSKERQNMLKRKVRGIFPIDIRSGSPLPKGDHPSQFDVITTSLCFEAATQNLDEYEKVVQNAASLLKRGGHLVSLGLLDNDYYEVGNFKFLCASLSKDDIERLYKACGFQIINFKTKILDHDQIKNKKMDQWSGQFALHAVKK
ncbi:nicotinamide N-methyltransferase-like [Pecten maximus]|uniref:nicotinamide N-methyltransferase-like n=1 Tax=Pecten maximus TaxID=6579 RepID=UPI001457EB0B|nr:nicotinamide N-methyltransferase-like [Pecten maximus]